MKFKITNPIVGGYYADPEARFYNGEYWIYVTGSGVFKSQLNLSAFHSPDLMNWEWAGGIIDMEGFPYVHQAVWAPTIIEKNGLYYLIFASNDIQNNNEVGGLEITVSESPAGPFKSLIGRSLVDHFINGAQPIDAHLFKDDDGKIYLLYGGWRHCNIAVMNDDMKGLGLLPNGKTFMEITPEGYTEAPCMFKRNGKYYFQWSTGIWTDNTYGVSYAIADSPVGPFTQIDGRILTEDGVVAKGPGHHGYLHIPEEDLWLMFYHRRPLNTDVPHERVLCIDEIRFDGDKILPVKMTHEWEYK